MSGQAGGGAPRSGSEQPVADGREPLSVLGHFWLWHPPVWNEERRTGILDELFFEDAEWRPYVSRFSVLLALSTMIAAMGLVANSAAVVIGAMLIAPLMTPILAVAAAAVHGQLRRVLISTGVLVAGSAAAVVTGWLVAIAMPGEITADELSAELLARTAPSLVDLGIAIAAGLAGGYVLTHPRAKSSLPGVAIAVALVPPLATVGITLQVGATRGSTGALLLYLTNMVAIVLSAMIVMLASGFVPPEVRRVVRTRVRFGLIMAMLAVAAVAVPLTAHTVDVLADQRFGRAVLGAVGEWDPQGRIVDIDSDTSPERARVSLVMASSRAPAPAWRLAEMLAEVVSTPIDVLVEYRQERKDEATAG